MSEQTWAPEAEDRWVTALTLARLLDMTPKGLANWRQRGCGPPFHRMPDGTARYSLREVHAWMEARRVSGGSR